MRTKENSSRGSVVQLVGAMLAVIAFTGSPGCAGNHPHSCGPAALRELLLYNDHDVSSKDISRLILENSPVGNAYRICLWPLCEIAGENSTSITWPDEMCWVLQRYGLSARQIDVDPAIAADQFYSMQSRDDVFLVLLRQEKSFSYHWLALLPNYKFTLLGAYGAYVMDRAYVIEPAAQRLASR